MAWLDRKALVRAIAAVIAVGVGLVILIAPATAQTQYPRDEIFGGYSVLFPNGWEELNYRADTIPNAFDASNSWYFCKFCNLGLLLDGSAHFRGSTTPPNHLNGSQDSTDVGYALAGLQYKWHHEKLSPFVRVLVGGANMSPDCCHGTQWSFAVGGGGGLDLQLSRRISLRLIQADYLYSSYPHTFSSSHPKEWNSVRLATGLVFSFGKNSSPSCNPEPKACVITSSSPTDVSAGEPVKLLVTGSNFNASHTLNYSWKTTGGKTTSGSAPATDIDTAGLAPGSYTLTATVVDPKLKTDNSATCAGAFVIKTPPPPVPPSLICVVNPAAVDAGQSATVTMTPKNPDGRSLTYAWSASSGQLVGSGTSATLTPTNNDAGNAITVTGTVTDDRGLSALCKSTINVHTLPPPCVKLLDWGECTFEKDGKRPWRVDNDCKDVLDSVALKLQGMPGGILAIVGYNDPTETRNALAAQRSANAKYYLVTDGPNKLDAARIQARQGGVKTKSTHFYFVPDGTLCPEQADLGSAVDETTVKGQSRGAPAPHKKTAPAPQP